MVQHLCLSLALLLASTAWAQPAAKSDHAGHMAPNGAMAKAMPARADPSDPQAAVPALVWRSSFIGFRGIALPPVLGWKEANDQVHRIGGWRAYAREANEPEPAMASPVAPATSTTPGNGQKPSPNTGHIGHHKP